MWSWGLSNQYVPYQWPHGAGQHGRAAVHGQPVCRHGRAAADAAGQPACWRPGLHATTPRRPLSITSPTGGTSFSQGQTVTITGTASDVGGRVAGIEVSTDGGATWHPATGTTNWSYTWTASGAGTHVIEARATDDSVNLQTSPATLSVNVDGSPRDHSLFTAVQHPGAAPI